jgi:glycosyltransferase involved in cell wall biosynthesis
MESYNRHIFVSAVIITPNRLPLLKAAIQSVLNQDYELIECIVVDDASSDGTYEYCSQFESIVYIRIDPGESKGGNYARNLGIKKSHGEYIAFLDDDDTWLPQKISKQVNVLNNKSDIGLVYCGRIIHSIINDVKTMDFPNIYDKGDISKRVLYKSICVTSTIMVRKELLFGIGLFDESLSFWQERELLTRLCQTTKVDFINKCLVVYRNDTGDKDRLTNKYKEWLITYKQIYNKHKSLHNKLTFCEKCIRERTFYADAMNRSLVSGDIAEYCKNKMILLFYKIILLPYKFYQKVTPSPPIIINRNFYVEKAA